MTSTVAHGRRTAAAAHVGAALLAALVAGCELLPGYTPAANVPDTTSAAVKPAKVMPLTPPTWKVGDRWDYSDGYSITVTELLPDGLARFRLTDGRDQWMVRRAFFTDSSYVGGVTRTVVFRTSDPLELFNVPPGTPVNYMREVMRNGETLRQRLSWVVEGRETITVPAGTFDCWVVVGRTNSLTTHYQGYERWWYSPDVRHYVRLEYKSGEHPEESRVLVSYKLSGQASELKEKQR